MARPERHDVDYFPFIVKDGRTFFILEDKYACKGIGFFSNMCRFLSQTPDHHYSLFDEVDKMYFFSKVKCDEESGMDMLNIMAKTGKIHRQLWEEKRVIASPDFLKNIEDAYKNRKNKIITIDEICKIYGLIDVSYQKNPQEDVITYEENPQTILKNTKLKETISKTERFLIFEIFYFKNFENPKSETERFINHYSSVGWKNASNIEVTDKLALAKNWTQQSKNKMAPEKLLLQWHQAYLILKSTLKEKSNVFLDLIPDSIVGTTIIFSTKKPSMIIIEENYLNQFKSSVIAIWGSGTKIEYKI